MLPLKASSVDADDTKFNMSYLYFGNSSAYTDLVSDTEGSLKDVAPSYFDLNDDGSLKLSVSLKADFINDMHVKGIKVTPFLSNHWDRQSGINALAIRDSLASQIVDAIVKYNLDGVNVDLENLTGNERDSYTDFVRLLKEKLPAGKSLSVAVAPKPYSLEENWQKSYDYAGLAQYADYLMLMTYDQHYQGGPEGPVASAQFVEDSIKNALKEVPSDKIVLGLAFYGRYWKQGATYGGYGVSADVADVLIKKYRGVVTYNSVYQSPRAVITITSSDVKPYVAGKQLSAGKYDIWYENEKSIKYKLTLVKKYNLKGSGSWSLGQETEQTWDYYKLWLNGYYFGDVNTAWAVDSIIKVANLGWMVGISSNQFSPNSALTRAQAVAILVRALGLSESSGDSSTVPPFTDISGHWAEKEIDIARQNNITQGIGGGKFGPNIPVTREQMAIMLARLPVQYLANSNSTVVFSDISPETNSSSYASIIKMAQAGVIRGYPDGTFHPRDNITRAQMAVLMDKASVYITDGTVVASVP
jgi:Predicted glycosyl hydrolase